MLHSSRKQWRREEAADGQYNIDFISSLKLNMKEKADRLQMIHNSEIIEIQVHVNTGSTFSLQLPRLYKIKVSEARATSLSVSISYQLKAKLSGHRGGTERALQHLSFMSDFFFLFSFFLSVPTGSHPAARSDRHTAAATEQAMK